MPVLVLFMWILLNRQTIVKEHTNTRAMNIIFGIAFLFTTFMAIQGIKGLLALI